MKKKYKSKPIKQLRKIFGEAEPTLCPECGKELRHIRISCGSECCYDYICFKCFRELVIGSKSGMISNEKLSQNELIERIMEWGWVKWAKLSREDVKKLIKGMKECQKNSLG